MEDPKTIKLDGYKTTTGKSAFVYGWGKNNDYGYCYIGMINGRGYTTWNVDGKDISGIDDLVLEIK